jgi:SAM-dependent methyltransferase
MKIREYKNYEEYITHQSQKLALHKKKVAITDKEVENTVYNRYKGSNVASKSILCLAARLGGEVRAFKKLGALAIGIDIAPGDKNPDVLYGDFHQLEFPDKSFDIVFSNAIDHVLYLDKYLSEASRVLTNDGIFILELAVQKAGSYETMDTQDVKPIIDFIEKYFRIDSEYDVDNWKVMFLTKS